MAAVPVFLGTQVSAQQNMPEQEYRLDPVLSKESPHSVTEPAGLPVVIQKDAEKGSVRLQTESPVSPYIGAGQKPELSPEERRLLEKEQASNGLSGYHLEAGVGLQVEDKASLSLGYRFNNPPSLLNERSNDPLTLSGDLRIIFGVKVPFD